VSVEGAVIAGDVVGGSIVVFGLFKGKLEIFISYNFQNTVG